ncbi:MAG: hypothetical protein ACYTEZ_15920 [Planctomycetota bacterium]
MLLLLAAGCQAPPDEAKTPADPATRAPPPLKGVANAYEEAARRKLEEVPPQEYPGLHNVYQLSDRILSGSEPHGEEALARLSRMGVKTILSVDGKVPDAETAARHGMRYVHVPIQYRGITEDELARIVKTFRELEGPFFVHCFHGKHRGPAAAAVGRLVVDGAPREQALAEMRQWCGTSKSYEGLYRTIASQAMPSTTETARYGWAFPAAHPLGGLRQTMVEIARHWDNLKLLAPREWQADPEHPDVDARNEADKLAGLFARARGLDSVTKAPEDFRDWMETSAAESGSLLAHLKAGATAKASKAFRIVKQTCSSCHAGYRNE